MGDPLAVEVVPVQTRKYREKGGEIPRQVVMAAYEVYCHLYGRQDAMVTGGCRGGFSSGELIAFLYAKGFPKNEWSSRVDEAFRGMKGL